MTVEATTHRLRAVNPSTSSENRIHADDVARQFGFRGGLVPGVVLWAHLTSPVVACAGPAFLDRGWMRARFSTPVYDGDEIVCTADPSQPTEAVGPGTEVFMQLSVVRGEDECATGVAALTNAPARPLLPIRDLPAERPAASEDTLGEGLVLGSLSNTFRADKAAAFLDTIAEPLALYRAEGIAHPGWLVWFANTVLVQNVVLGPWIHVESEAFHHGVVSHGDTVVTRARVTRNYERKGHQFVDVHVQLTVDDRPVLDIDHRAIWALRPAAG